MGFVSRGKGLGVGVEGWKLKDWDWGSSGHGGGLRVDGPHEKERGMKRFEDLKVRLQGLGVYPTSRRKRIRALSPHER